MERWVLRLACMTKMYMYNFYAFKIFHYSRGSHFFQLELELAAASKQEKIKRSVL